MFRGPLLSLHVGCSVSCVVPFLYAGLMKLPWATSDVCFCGTVGNIMWAWSSVYVCKSALVKGTVHYNFIWCSVDQSLIKRKKRKNPKHVCLQIQIDVLCMCICTEGVLTLRKICKVGQHVLPCCASTWTYACVCDVWLQTQQLERTLTLKPRSLLQANTWK